jgi:hypothetical protein
MIEITCDDANKVFTKTERRLSLYDECDKMFILFKVQFVFELLRGYVSSRCCFRVYTIIL